MGNADWYVNLETSMPGNFWNTLIFGRLVQFAKHQHNDLLPQRITWAGYAVEISMMLLKHGTRCCLSLCPFLNLRELLLYIRCESAGWPSELLLQHATTPTVPPRKIWSITLKWLFLLKPLGKEIHTTKLLYMLCWYKEKNIRIV